MTSTRQVIAAALSFVVLAGCSAPVSLERAIAQTEAADALAVQEVTTRHSSNGELIVRRTVDWVVAPPMASYHWVMTSETPSPDPQFFTVEVVVRGEEAWSRAGLRASDPRTAWSPRQTQELEPPGERPLIDPSTGQLTLFSPDLDIGDFVRSSDDTFVANLTTSLGLQVVMAIRVRRGILAHIETSWSDDNGDEIVTATTIEALDELPDFPRPGVAGNAAAALR